MIKTFTKQHAEHEQTEEIPGLQLDEMFYNQIKSDLDKLTREPSEDVIENILAYSRQKEKK